MQESNFTFVLRDAVEGYFMVYDGSCSVTGIKEKATVFKLVLENGEFYTRPSIPDQFLKDRSHAWRPEQV